MENKQRGNMESIYHKLADMKLTKVQRAVIAGMLGTAFVNGFQTALADHAGITDETGQYQITSQNETAQHIIFLAQENSK